MKLGVVGKGGVGKTTLSGLLSRSIAAAGHRVIALDCDANPNLGISLGLGVEPTDRLAGIRQALDLEDDTALDHAPTAKELLDRFGVDGPDGIRLAVVTKIEEPKPG